MASTIGTAGGYFFHFNSGHTFINATASDLNLPPGCSISAADASNALVLSICFSTWVKSTVSCADGATIIVGSSTTYCVGNFTVALDMALATTITPRAPDGAWYGAGFGAQLKLSDQPWTLVVNGSGGVAASSLGYHTEGFVLGKTAKVVQHSVSGGVCTVVLSRTLKGASSAYFTFKPSAADSTIPIIAAVGYGPKLDSAPQYHAVSVCGCKGCRSLFDYTLLRCQ